jgi:hypothetical protein
MTSRECDTIIKPNYFKNITEPLILLVSALVILTILFAFEHRNARLIGQQSEAQKLCNNLQVLGLSCKILNNK